MQYRQIFYRLCLVMALGVATGCGSERELVISGAWLSQAPPGVSMRAVYASLVNHSSQAITINNLSSPQFGLVELHRTVIEGGVARMRQVTDLKIPSGERVVLEPGGLHIMLMRPTVSDTISQVQIQLQAGEQTYSFTAEVNTSD